ncbi:MAG TPA: vWA domain-containing protein [Candidatus Acidoferrales bacterium]|nr:vWA domain-containing protein [Candidatus Acidoferrales bacterium]
MSTVDGSVVPPLESTNFAGIFHKKPIQIISAAINQEPIRVVLLIDVSASMRGPDSEDQNRYALDVAEDLVSGISPETSIGLGFFYSEFIPVLRPTVDRRSLLPQIEGLRSHPKTFYGQTALWNAVLEGAKMFDHPHAGDVIYVITDGGDNASHTKVKFVEQALEDTGIRLNAFVFQSMPTARKSPEELIGPTILENVARETGGTVLTQITEYVNSFLISGHSALVDKSGKLTPLGLNLSSQIRQMRSFYRVEFELPEALNNQQEWKLELEGLEKSQREKIILSYPQRLAACH